jgi:small multidrug resistance family-3 protein
LLARILPRPGFYGVYGAIALLWLWRVDGVLPTAWSLAGVGVTLAGMGIILWGG